MACLLLRLLSAYVLALVTCCGQLAYPKPGVHRSRLMAESRQLTNPL